MPHFCYTIAVTAYNRIFDEAIENYGLITTSKAIKSSVKALEEFAADRIAIK